MQIAIKHLEMECSATFVDILGDYSVFAFSTIKYFHNFRNIAQYAHKVARRGN